MAKFLSRLRSRIFLFIFIIVFVLFIFNLPLIFKESFLHIKNTIQKGIGDALDKKVSIEKIYFLPYGELILNNVRIYDRENIPYVDIKRIHIQFKLLPLLIDKTVIITRGTFVEPIFHPPSKNLRIVGGEKKALDKYKLKLNRHLAIKVKSGKVILPKGYSAPALNSIGFSFWAKLKEGNRVYSEGWIDLKEFPLKDYLLNDIFFFEFDEKIGYKLKASLVNNTVLVDELTLDFKQFKIETTGLIENYNTDPIANFRFKLKELDFPDELYLKSKLFIFSIRNFIVHVKGALKAPRWFIRLDEFRSKFVYLPAAIIKLDNFYCNLRVSRDGFSIDYLNCFLNNFPIGLKCKLSNFESPHIELSLISYPGQIPSLRPFNPLNFEFSFSGYKYEDSIKAKASIEIERLISTNPRKTHYLKLTISDLLCRFSGKQIPSMPSTSVPLSIEAKDIVYEFSAPGPRTRLDLADLTFLLYPDGNRIYFADLNLSGYEGLLKGDGFLDCERLPPRAFLDFEFSDFNMAELADRLYLDCDLTGILSGKGVLDSRALSYLVARATILNGSIKNLKLLDLIADFLSIISLKNIYFEDFSSKFSFSVAGNEISLDNIRLRSDDVYLDANFKFRNRRKINGNMLVRLSTKLLKESFKLRMLFFLMGERLPYADFEFKIGGLVNRPQIRWLDTEFKKSLMRYLSKGQRKGLEKEVEEAMEPLLENK